MSKLGVSVGNDFPLTQTERGDDQGCGGRGRWHGRHHHRHHLHHRSPILRWTRRVVILGLTTLVGAHLGGYFGNSLFGASARADGQLAGAAIGAVLVLLMIWGRYDAWRRLRQDVERQQAERQVQQAPEGRP